MQISTTFGISKFTKKYRKRNRNRKQKLALWLTFLSEFSFYLLLLLILLPRLYIYRLPQLRGRVAVHAEQVDDAVAEAGREAILPRHLLQGKPHSVGHWPFTQTAQNCNRDLRCDRSDRCTMTVQRSLRCVDCTYILHMVFYEQSI